MPHIAEVSFSSLQHMRMPQSLALTLGVWLKISRAYLIERVLQYWSLSATLLLTFNPLKMFQYSVKYASCEVIITCLVAIDDYQNYY